MGKGDFVCKGPKQEVENVKLYLKIYSSITIPNIPDITGADGTTRFRAKYTDLSNRVKKKIINHLAKNYQTKVIDDSAYESRLSPKLKNSLLSFATTYFTTLGTLITVSSGKTPDFLEQLKSMHSPYYPLLAMLFPFLTPVFPGLAAFFTFYVRSDSK